ncbi:unnamed protein product [Brassica rapa]|uniref:Non-specific serine/threonine protein kinase n=1 Tax=Brassica campestris TaxID=3711 RepID=A0A3P6CY69_BRACM|nr:unnamed protein product [Brassica rapa]VDD15425.1 unnamed protein product [Brassica rapa]
MKGVQNIYNNAYSVSSLLVFFVLILFRPALSISAANRLSSSESLTISSNRTLVSPGGAFELGFFKPSALPRWYLGIRYKKVSEKTYAWVANRNNPLFTSIGTLKISGNNLHLLDQSNNTVWWTSSPSGDVTAPVIAELLSNGNFVLRHSDNNDDPSSFLWQSFDFPTDTLLPEMKLGIDHKKERNWILTSWRAADDPASGNFTFNLETQWGLPEFILRSDGRVAARSGPWDGIEFSGIPEMQRSDNIISNFTVNSGEAAYSFRMTNHSIYSILTARDWMLVRVTWTSTSLEWKRSEDNLFTDICDVYHVCYGPNTYCDINTSPRCNCIRGFVPQNATEWAERDEVLGRSRSGCVRKTPLNCEEYHDFVLLNNTKLPDTKTATVDQGIIDEKICKERCLSDCNCTSFAFGKNGLGCVTWTGDLVDIRTYFEGGYALFVKVPAADDPDFSSGEKRDRTGNTIGWSIGGVSVLLLLSVILFCFWKRRQKQAKADATPIEGNQVQLNEMVLRNINSSREDEIEDLDLPLMDFEAVVAATERFSHSNQVGKGGFGAVYKGRLSDGQEIAVKRLSAMSAQGTDEFLNEVRLIARLQHVNLVRLLGCCVQANEKILIYEYLENLSLDSHIFDKTRSSMLNWQMRFDIINGIARGLLYLHQDSRFRIIHRDLKASNVLLDKDMAPKISDFGLARMFGRDETEANTRKVVGTYGYMSPEYAMNGTFSMKSDVFSFGVLLLEIISGKRNKGFCVWRNWNEGQGLEIVDTAVIVDSSSPTCRPREILRCLQIGLLCVQERVEDRPMMSSVVLMLGSEAVFIPQPKRPGYCVASGSSLDTRSEDESFTVNKSPPTLTLPLLPSPPSKQAQQQLPHICPNTIVVGLSDSSKNGILVKAILPEALGQHVSGLLHPAQQLSVHLPLPYVLARSPSTPSLLFSQVGSAMSSPPPSFSSSKDNVHNSFSDDNSSSRVLTLPTVLTLCRVAAVPLLVATFYVDGWWGATATTSIFVAAAVTDWLDGYLARKMKLGSAFGAFLDPVADKLMVAATLILLCTKPIHVSVLGPVPWLLTVPSIAIIGREITMSAVREWAASQNGKLLEAVAVNNLGKWKTATQMTALTILLASRDSSVGWLVASGAGLLYVSAGLSVWSLVVYMRKISKVLLK